VLNPEAATFQSVFTNTVRKENKTIALRTVPVAVKSGNKQLRINALLDDGSTTTYINTDIALELGLNGTRQYSTVNTINGRNKTFCTMSVNFEIVSENGAVKIPVEAKTINNITGNLQTTDWSKHAKQWKHL